MVYVKRTATYQDCVELGVRLRSEDLKELLASRPDINPATSLYECVEVSSKSFAVHEEGIGCIAIFGVRECHLGGIPWLLASDLLIEKSTKKFIKQSKEYMRELTDDFSYSFNLVSASNVIAHRWLKWLGFTVNKTHTSENNGVVFYPFTYTRKVNV